MPRRQTMTTHLQTTAAAVEPGPRHPEALRSRRTGQPVDLERGVLTVAFGSSRYTRMARILADSLELHCPDLPRALVTDSQDRRLLDRYDVCVPYDEPWGRGF